MLRLDPGDGRIRTARSSRSGRAAANTTSCAACASASGKRAAVVTAHCRQRPRPAARGPDAAGRRRHVPRRVGAVRRHRPRRPRGTELHREGLRHPPGGRLLRPRPLGGLADSSPGDIDWEQLFERGGRALAPLRRHLRGALRRTTAEAVHRGDGGRQEARHRRLLRPELPRLALEVPGRQGPRARGQPRDRPARRRDDRQRGGFHRRLGFEVPGMDEHLSNIDPRTSRR